MIRKANIGDTQRVVELLHQVDMVHHYIRPDLFKPNTTKYDEEELKVLQPSIDTAVEVIKSFVLAGIDLTMNQFNSRGKK